MANIGRLAVQVEAKTSPLTKGLARAQRSVSSFARAAGRAARTGVLALAAGAAAAGAAIATVTIKALGSVDALAKLADQLAVSTEFLDAFRHASSIAGVSQDAADKSLQRFVVRLGQASAGVETYARTYRQLGLDAEALSRMGTEEAFAATAQAISELASPTDQARVAFDLFGRTGVELLGVLRQGASGIADAQDELEGLGGSLSRIDAAQVELANDSITRLQKSIALAGQRLSVELAPFIDAAAQAIARWGSKSSSAVELVAGGIAFVADLVHTMQIAFQAARVATAASFFGIFKAIDFVGEKLIGLINLIPGMEAEWTDSIGVMADGFRDLLNEEAVELQALVVGPSGGDKVRMFFDDLRKQSREAAEKIAQEAEERRIPLEFEFNPPEADVDDPTREAQDLAARRVRFASEVQLRAPRFEDDNKKTAKNTELLVKKSDAQLREQQNATRILERTLAQIPQVVGIL